MPARIRRMVYFTVGAIALVVLAGTALAQSDSNLGTWKLNVAKAKFAGLPPMSETRVFEVWESDGIKYTSTRVQADGSHIAGAFSAHYDGKDYKLTGIPDSETIALKHVSANKTSFTVKRAGKVVQTGAIVVSRNGKVGTRTITGMNAKGQKETNVAVYDKQ